MNTYNDTRTDMKIIMKTKRLARKGREMACEWLGNMTTRKRSSVKVTMIQGEAARHAFRSKANERHMACFWSLMLSGKSRCH